MASACMSGRSIDDAAAVQGSLTQLLRRIKFLCSAELNETAAGRSDHTCRRNREG